MVAFQHRTNLSVLHAWKAARQIRTLRGLLRRHRVHVEDFPDVAVQVLKSMGVHEPIVLGITIGAAAGGERLADEFINARPAFTRERHEDFRACGCITDFFGSEFLELGVREQHDIDVPADNHASGGFVGELGIESKAEALEKVHGPAEVLNRQINEYLRRHFWCVVGLLSFGSAAAILERRS